MNAPPKAKKPRLQALSALRTLLFEMEQDVGLSDLSAAEKDVLFAAHAVSAENEGTITSEAIRHHALASNLAQATYHRALRSLLTAGFLIKAPGTKAGRYVLHEDI